MKQRIVGIALIVVSLICYCVLLANAGGEMILDLDKLRQKLHSGNAITVNRVSLAAHELADLIATIERYEMALRFYAGLGTKSGELGERAREAMGDRK